MKRIVTAVLFAIVAGSMILSSFAHAQSSDMDAAVDACGRLTQELNLAEEQRMSLEAQILNATALSDVRALSADRDHVVAMIKEINEDMNKNAACQ